MIIGNEYNLTLSFLFYILIGFGVLSKLAIANIY